MSYFIAYFDESGDDGKLSVGGSDYFVLANTFIPLDEWDNYRKQILEARRAIRDKYKVSFIRKELHTRDFLLSKNLEIKKSHNQKLKFADFRLKIVKELLREIVDRLKATNTKIITTVIDKKHKRNKSLSSLDLVSKVIRENLSRMNMSTSQCKTLICSDKGREGVVLKATRKIRAYHPIWVGRGKPLDGTIKNIVEDCIFKDSKHCYFVQLSDIVAYFSMLYLTQSNWAKKISKVVGMNDLDEVFGILSPLLVKESTKSNDRAIAVI